MKHFVFVLLLAVSTSAWAVSTSDINDPNWRAANMPQMIGVIGGLGPEYLLVRDRRYLIDASTRFSTSGGLSLTLQQLKAGDQVMVFAQPTDAGPLAQRVVVIK